MKLFLRAVAVAAAVLIAPSMAAAQEGDAAKGEKIFKRCATCHMVGDKAKTKVGPILNNVIGRVAGAQEDALKRKRYGKSMIAVGEAGFKWTGDEIYTYLEDPRGWLRAKYKELKIDGRAASKMAFRLRKEQDRRDVIAYVAQFSKEAAPTN